MTPAGCKEFTTCHLTSYGDVPKAMKHEKKNGEQHKTKERQREREREREISSTECFKGGIMATCSDFWEGVLKLLNFALGTLGLIMLGYGVYLLVELNQVSGGDENIPALFQLSRSLLMELWFPNNFVNKLSNTWFVYVLTGVGVALFIISLFGYIGAVTKSRICLSLVIQADKTGYLHEVYSFLKQNWKAMKWFALGVVTLEALAFLVAFVVRGLNTPPDEFDSDLDCESPAGSNSQPLIHSQRTESSTDQQNSCVQEPIRTDSWSQRMREKVEDLYSSPSSQKLCNMLIKKLNKTRKYS
ncbi:Tobamovirus multiplication protein 2A [Carex littledalei]|uniref:Tobamovirus multiplication protein 2A n=1 Tax=Carex littledalei TaxID=544730 RepID=A0A833VSM7_9POAL|nr:Tobamovirus multiplication protein 2A [Carex littledalei]